MKKDNRLRQAIQNSHKLLCCPIQSHHNNSTTARTHSSISKKNECLKKKMITKQSCTYQHGGGRSNHDGELPNVTENPVREPIQ